MNSFWIRIMTIDRRLIFLGIAIVIIIPILFPFKQPIRILTPVRQMFDAIESIPKGQALFLSVDYDPQGEPELSPMYIAMLRHAFERKIPVGILSLYPTGTGLAEQGFSQVVNEFNSRAACRADSVIYGVDAVHLGWQTPVLGVILGLGKSVRTVYPEDFYGNTTKELPMLDTIKNYNNVGLLVCLSSSSTPVSYVSYAQNRFGLAVGAAITAVSAADLYPYLNSGQFSGMIAGMKGAAEYEELVETELGIGGRRKALEAMGSQSTSHLAIIFLIIIGNLGYFMSRRKSE